MQTVIILIESIFNKNHDPYYCHALLEKMFA